ncbi:MAG: DegV family protein [Dehalococcoidia bacterium]|jgi:DegV family protein with EDD domain|nr:DegV family protein [Dehalococcoidia bacterium]
MTVRIVTDSTADLPVELAAKHRIEVVPLTVLFGDEALLDGVDIDTDTFFERLARSPELPTSSQPSPAAFRERYEQLVREGATEILSIHLAGSLSGTLASAQQGAEGLDVRVEHVDSGLASLALGLGVLKAGRVIEAGGSLDEAKAQVEDQFSRTRAYFVLDTLDYLLHGGRIGRVSHVFGTMLKVKPVLTFENGEVVQLARARTQAKALEKGIELAQERFPLEVAGTMHAVAPERMQAVADRLHELAPDVPIVTGTLGPTIGVHAGPGAVGFTVISSPAPGG